MALVAKMLGGIGKATVGIGGTVLKGGAKLFGDNAVKALGHGVGKAQKGLDDIVQAAVKQDDLYKAAVKEARGTVSDTAKEAIKNPAKEVIKNPAKNYKTKTEFGSADGTRYRMREVDGKKVYESKAKDGDWSQIQDQGRTKASQIYGKARGEYIAYNDSLAEQVADDISKTAPGDGAGIDLLQFASNHPVGTALAGLGVGMGVHALFDND